MPFFAMASTKPMNELYSLSYDFINSERFSLCHFSCVSDFLAEIQNPAQQDSESNFLIPSL